MTGSSQPLVITDFLYRAQDMFGDKQIIDHVDGVETMRYDYRTYAEDTHKGLSAQVNVDNLFDKKYYSQAGSFSQYRYGAPRNFTISANYKF